MRSKIIGGAVAVAAAGSALFAWRAAPKAIANDPCIAGTGVATGVAIEHGRLTDGRGSSARVSDPGGHYALRHVAARGAAVAYVRDRRGHDQVVVAGPGGAVTVIRQRGEAFHPSWAANGALAWGLDGAVVIRSPHGSLRSIPGPHAGGLVMAPVFDTNGLVAAVAAPQTPAVPEDTWSDDLWRLTGGRWSQLTHFAAGRDRWSAVRTPMRAPDGTIEFVLVQGRGSADRMPRFQLWQLDGAIAHRERSLAGEAYLAGYDPEGRRLWNVPDRATETWLLETDDGSVIGCGAVAVDPMDTVDPDRTGHAAPPPARSRALGDLGDPIEPALLVGDFASESAASVVAERLTHLNHGSLPVDVIHGGHRSSLVAPEHWAVLVRLGAAGDGEQALAALRAQAPDLRTHTWVVVR